MTVSVWRDADPISLTLLAAGLSSIGLPSAIGAPPLAHYTTSPRRARKLLTRGKREQMLPMLARYFGRQARAIERGRLLAFNNIFSLLATAHYSELGGLSADLRAAGVNAMLVKGADLAFRCYPHDLPRAMRDVDLLVRPRAADGAARVLFARGFVHGEIDRRASTLVEIPSATGSELMRGHYEFLPFARLVAVPALDRYRSAIPFIRRRYGLFVRGGHVLVRLAFDLHFNLLLRTDADVWWQRARPVSLQPGTRYHVLDPADALWFLSTRLHAETMQHGEQSMRGLIDVAACLARFRRRVDWRWFRRAVAQGGMAESIGAIGYAVEALVPGLVPVEWPRPRCAVDAAHQFAAKLVQISRQPIAIRRAETQ